MSAPPPASPGGARVSIRRLRAAILVALCLGVAVFTGVMVKLVDDLSAQFGPQVRADLEWRALRAATELASSADLGVTLEDHAMVMEAFQPHIASTDVLEVAAVNAAGEVIARHGSHPPLGPLFAAQPGTVLEGEGYLASWRPVQIEGAPVGKVAVVVSTARITSTRAMLARVSLTTLVAGALVLLCGALVLLYFTREVVSRDQQLGDYAATLAQRVEDRTRQLDERNRGMRLVFDNVAQGFITIDRDGVMAAERSAVVDAWFGAPPEPPTFAEQVRKLAPDFAAWFDLTLEMLRDGLLPAEVGLGQLPRRFEAHGRIFDMTYSPIFAAAGAAQVASGEPSLERILVIASDVTEQLAHERAEKEQRELLAVFQRIVADRTSCEEYLSETAAMLAQLQSSEDRTVQERLLHTLKGNSGMFGFETFAELCHQLENELVESVSTPLGDEQRARIAHGGGRVVVTMTTLLGGNARDVVEIERPELLDAIELARHGVGTDEMASLLTTWSYEPVARRFERFGQQARQLARRLGKGEVQVSISDGGIRLDPAHWTPLWMAMVHLIRNAIDHGLESPEERAQLGKGPPHLTFAATRTEHQLVFSLTDDGRGIDWAKLREMAVSRGERATARRELVRVMFEDGVSTRDEATQTSGRGVGLAALRAVVTSLGGTVEVESEPGSGTRFELQFPLERRTSPVAARSSSAISAR